MDYQGNAKHSKAKELKVVPSEEKQIEKLNIGEVQVKKRGLGRKIKDLVIEADIRTVIRDVAFDVMLPAARNMLFDGATNAVQRMIYGDAAPQRGSFRYSALNQSRITYNTPVSRPYRDAPSRIAPPIPQAPRSRHGLAEIILETRSDAEIVLERMNDIIDKYQVVSVSDLNELVGIPGNHIDNKWGWEYLKDVQIRQVREGFLIDLPQPDPIV